MIIHCSYCRRGNGHTGVCDGCGAPLPEVQQFTPQQLWTYTPMMSTNTHYMQSANDYDMGYHNRRLKK